MEAFMARFRTENTRYATLAEALASRNAEVLKALARLFGTKKPVRKADCIAIIEEALAGEGLRRLWDDLDDLSRSAIAEVTHGIGERLDLESFTAKYGSAPRRHHEDYYDKKKNVPWTPLDVIFTADVMPRDLKERFRIFVQPPPEPAVETVDTLPPAVQLPLPSWMARKGTPPDERPLAVCETEAAALQDLAAVLRLIDAGKVGASAATRRPTLAGARAVAAVLRDGDFIDGNKADDFIRAFAWPLLVQAAGLARLAGSRLELTKAGRKAFSIPGHETIRRIWQRWISKGLIDEFNRIEAIKGQKRKGRGGLTAVADRRAIVEEVLSACPAGKWIGIDEFFRFFQATGEDFEVVRDPWKLYIAEAHYGSLGYDGCHKWSMIQGRYVMALLWEYAATLGLADIAHIPAEGARDDYRDNWGTDDLDSLSRYDGLKFFRITDLGAYCLDIAEEYVQTPKPVRPAIKILPNHDIVIEDAPRFSSADALFLERIAVNNGDHLWTMDKRRIQDALENGIQSEEIHGFLDTLSQTPVPDNVRQFIDDTVQRAFLVSREETAELFRTADEATALLIAHDNAAKNLCYLAGPMRLAVPSRHVAAFRRALRQLGFAVPPAKTIK
jgi:DNA-binding transcriptional MerR regulator